MARTLKCTYSVVPACDLFPDLGIKYKYTLAARWYQFWRWHLIFDRNYVLSRAAEIVLMEHMAEAARTALEEMNNE